MIAPQINGQLLWSSRWGEVAGHTKDATLGAPLMAESDQNARVVTAINRPVTIFVLIPQIYGHLSKATVISPDLRSSRPDQALSVWK